MVTNFCYRRKRMKVKHIYFAKTFRLNYQQK